MCCIGVMLRRWVPLFRNYLVPAIVIAGLLGMILMNLGLGELFEGVDGVLFGSITAELFTLTFISIGLTAAPRSASKGHHAKPEGWRRIIPQSAMVKGAWAMGITWVVFWTVQQFVGVGVVASFGTLFGMPAEYGLMAAFSFAQGPGQAATLGAIFVEQGWEDAVNVGLTFSALGFIVSFLVGVPLARRGMRKGVTASGGEINESTKRGILPKEEQRESIGRVTTFSGSIESMGLALSIVGICYLMAMGIAWIFALIPGFMGDTLSGLMFMNGLFAAYIFRYTLNRLGGGDVLNPELQRKITGLFSDFTVVAAFMAVQIAVVMDWMVPILIVTLGVTGITLALSLYLGQHYGSDHDFERTLSMYGAGTGTAPTALALVRIVDPKLRTTTAAEIGLMHLPQQLYLPAMFVVSAIFAGSLSLVAGMSVLAAVFLGYAVLSFLAGNFKAPTYRLFGAKAGRAYSLSASEGAVLTGELADPASRGAPEQR